MTAMDEEQRQQLEWQRADALIAHEAHRKSMAEHVDLVGSFSTAAMRSPAIAGAGAIAALLGFFSANYRAIAASAGHEFFNQALLLFGVSVVLTVLAPGLAYFSQLSFLWSLGKEAFYWERPYVRPTRSSNFLNLIGVTIQFLTIGIVIGSIALLLLGGWKFLLLAQFVSERNMLP
ncbi:hypothetical protein ELH36_17745 [Rhizobium ruizarguesonis]|uniref:hypothetical protein n=1 Tax=Rhizobium ruizarguesonis TaxID=2081791 RepID=UPI00102FA221|nr:hypothetical protein [Rhizobium ruizarguesonis]TBC64445.1 hypothetical protein ELH36_17745 [Rhizobium ruizarguesonis]